MNPPIYGLDFSSLKVNVVNTKIGSVLDCLGLTLVVVGVVVCIWNMYIAPIPPWESPRPVLIGLGCMIVGGVEQLASLFLRNPDRN
ncbi:hypothetical protein [Streptomyces sp. NPDC051662]|uniref:hypothetical protein n=1 Tax=Streptomyces sp. NPDC051662 TaxID=3154750 RepID=UPI003420184E